MHTDYRPVPYRSRLKLGQPLTEVQKLFGYNGDHDSLAPLRLGLLEDSPDDVGVREQTIYGALLGGNSERLKGVRSLELRYLDNKLASINIRYDNSVKWQSDAHFAAAIAQQLQLPVAGWEKRAGELRLTCDGFFVDTSALVTAKLDIERSEI